MDHIIVAHPFFIYNIILKIIHDIFHNFIEIISQKKGSFFLIVFPK